MRYGGNTRVVNPNTPVGDQVFIFLVIAGLVIGVSLIAYYSAINNTHDNPVQSSSSSGGGEPSSTGGSLTGDASGSDINSGGNSGTGIGP